MEPGLILGASCLKTNLAAFCPMLRALVAEEAKVLGFPICEGGTVVTIQGPRLTFYVVNITTGITESNSLYTTTGFQAKRRATCSGCGEQML